MDLDSMDKDAVREALQQVIRHTNSNIVMWAVERDTALTALAELNGEEFEHYQNTIKMYENEMLFAQRKLAAAEARLAALD